MHTHMHICTYCIHIYVANPRLQCLPDHRVFRVKKEVSEGLAEVGLANASGADELISISVYTYLYLSIYLSMYIHIYIYTYTI